MPKIPLTSDLVKSILDCKALIEKRVADFRALGPDAGHIAARVHLREAEPVLVAIMQHWKRSIPGLFSHAIAPFVVDSVALRNMSLYCGAAKAADSLNMFQAHKGVTEEKVAALLAIFNRALQGRVYLTEDLSCENEEKNES